MNMNYVYTVKLPQSTTKSIRSNIKINHPHDLSKLSCLTSVWMLPERVDLCHVRYVFLAHPGLHKHTVAGSDDVAISVSYSRVAQLLQVRHVRLLYTHSYNAHCASTFTVSVWIIVY